METVDGGPEWIGFLKTLSQDSQVIRKKKFNLTKAKKKENLLKGHRVSPEMHLYITKNWNQRMESQVHVALFF